jgi:uncharacterized protein (TIGR03067 family)
MRLRFLILPLVLVGLFVATRADEPMPDDKKKVEGTWMVVGFEDAGRKWEDDVLKASGFRFELKDGKLTFTIKTADPMKSKETVDSASYKLVDKTDEKGAAYKGFDTTKDKDGKDDKGVYEKGIYKFDGDKLMLCIAPPGKDRPNTFDPKGTPNRLFILERDKTAAGDKEKAKDDKKDKDKDPMKDKDKDKDAIKDKGSVKDKDKDAKKDKDDKKDKDEKKDKQ